MCAFFCVPEPDIGTSVIEIRAAHQGNIESRFKCEVCSGYFKTKKIQKNHMKLKHSGNPALIKKAKNISKGKSSNRQCILCDELFNSRNLKAHFKSMHPNEPQHEICLICDKTFPNLSHFNRHMRNVHLDDRRFLCTLCDFRAKRKEHLRDHMKTHSAEKEYKCENCDFSTTRTRELKSHKCVTKNFFCEVCGQKSTSKDALGRHKKRRHS